MRKDHSVKQDSVRAIGLMIGAVFMLATMDLAIKQLVEHYSSMQVVVLRCVLSAPLFAVWILITDRSLFRPHRFHHHLSRAAVGVIMLFAVGECLREMQLADAYAIFFAAPLLLTILSGMVMKEPAGPMRLAAASVGFAGVLIVLKPGTVLISYGSAMGLLAVVTYAFVALMLRSLGRTEHSITIVFWFSTLVGVAAGLLSISEWRAIDPAHWPWLLTLGIGGSIGQLLLTSAFKRASAAVIAPYDYLHMIWAVLFGWVFWGELPGMRTWAGTAIIVASGMYILFREKQLKLRAARAGAQPPA